MRKIIHLIFLITFISVFTGLIFSPFSIKAQNFSSISGVVISKKTNQPIARANVTLQPGDKGTITSETGQFVFDGLKEGEYSLYVSYLGYKGYIEKFALSTGEALKVQVSLEVEVKLISGVEITGHSQKDEPFIRNTILLDDLRTMSAHDVGQILRSVPNVAGIRKGGSNLDPVVRGLKSGQLNVQANSGQKIEGGCPNRMDPTASHIDMNDISRIEIIKGPYALRYGPNFGAVIKLVTEKARPFETFQIHARAIKGWESNLNGDKGHVTIFGGNKAVYFALSGNNQNYGNYHSGNGTEIPSSFRKYNFTTELGLIPAKNHEVRFSYKNSQGRDVRFPSLPMDERSDNTHLMSATWRYFNRENTLQSMEGNVYRSEVNHEMDNKWRPNSDTVVAVSTVNALNTGGRADAGFKFRTADLHVGFDYENIFKDGQRVKSLIMQPGLPEKTEDLWQNASIQNLGFFAEYNYQQSNFANWMLAARIDFNNATSDPMQLKNMAGNEVFYNENVSSDFTNMSVSGGVTLKFNKKVSVDVALGRGVRSPDMVERYIILLPVGFDNYDYLGNPQLEPETNHQADLTFHHDCERSGNVKVNGFFSIISDFITGKKVPPSELTPQTAGVLGVKQFQNVDRACFYGFEFTWLSPTEMRLGGSLVAAYTAGYIPETEKYIIENGQVVGSEIVKNDPLPEIQPFEATAKIHYKWLENKLVPAFSVRFVAPQNRVSEAYDEMETPGFVLVGFNVDYQLSEILTLSGGVNNIFDRNYYEHLNRRIIGSKAALFEPGRVFFLNVMIEL